MYLDPCQVIWSQFQDEIVFVVEKESRLPMKDVRMIAATQ